MSLLDDLNWRYATKKMNGQSVPQDKVDYIIEAARLAPSSSGFQPYKLLVVTNKSLLKKIKTVAHNQSQITDCSHLLIWAAWNGYSEERIGEVLLQISRARGQADNTFDEYKSSLWKAYGTLGASFQQNHAAKQAYISFGMAIAAAAEQKVDATPMEGFNNSQLDALLGLEEKGLKSVVLLPLGYRDESNDWLVHLKKWRQPFKEFVIELK